MEDIDTEVVETIMKLTNYIPPQKGKVKVTKDPNSKKFTISTPLLPEKVPFEHPWLMRIPLLKIEDWDFIDHARFQHLAIHK